MSREEILAQLKSGKIKVEEAAMLLAEQMVPASSVAFTMKVSEKGCISFRGVPGTNGKFGLTLYAKSVQFLFAKRNEIEAWVKAHNAQLSWEKKAAA
jgi:hypothetical protein